MAEGKILLEYGAKPEKHELEIAKILIGMGRNVIFLKPIDDYKIKTPDIEYDNKRWEIKSPISSKEDSIERNLKRASKQSSFVIFDTSRMANLSKDLIRKNLLKQLKISHSLSQIIMIDKNKNIELLTKKSK